MEVWYAGDASRLCRRGGMKVWSAKAAGGVQPWRYGGTESRCRCVHLGVWRYGAMEVSSRRADMEVRRYRGMEL